ncbi:MAG: hypothetical protein Q7S92_03575 [Candidatus Diapherotrites archaeon]|nr:hypothetical protein [Candidatus Diapherotrites archaeon]
MDSQKYLILGITALIVFVGLIGLTKADNSSSEITGMVSLEIQNEEKKFTAEINSEQMFSAEPVEIQFSELNSSKQVSCTIQCITEER